jgi:hypothetical protein
LETNGARVHLVHPLAQHRVTRRVKNEVRDSTELAKRLRRGDLPEAYVAPAEQAGGANSFGLFHQLGLAR